MFTSIFFYIFLSFLCFSQSGACTPLFGKLPVSYKNISLKFLVRFAVSVRPSLLYYFFFRLNLGALTQYYISISYFILALAQPNLKLIHNIRFSPRAFFKPEHYSHRFHSFHPSRSFNPKDISIFTIFFWVSTSSLTFYLGSCLFLQFLLHHHPLLNIEISSCLANIWTIFQ